MDAIITKNRMQHEMEAAVKSVADRVLHQCIRD